MRRYRVFQYATILLILFQCAVPAFGQWEIVQETPLVLNRIAFLDDRVGASVASGDIMITRDHGDTWQNYSDSNGNTWGGDDVSFGPNGTALIVKNNSSSVSANAIYYSLDSGNTWNNAWKTLEDHIGEVQLMADGSAYILSAPSSKPGSLYRLQSFPDKWALQYQAEPGDVFRSMEFLNDSTLIIIGLSQDTVPSVFYSQNYGKSFSVHELPVNKISEMHTCVLTNEAIFVTTGVFSTILRSTDHGINWDTLFYFPGAFTKDVVFSGQDTGFLVLYDVSSQKDQILTTIDGGINWNTMSFPGFMVSSISVQDGSNAWITGQSGEIARLNPGLTGLGARSTPSNVSVYPNPVYNELHIGPSNSNSLQEILILNANGQEVYRGKTSTGTLDITYLPAGVYHLRILGTRSSASFIKR